jgi:hypothetical protein
VKGLAWLGRHATEALIAGIFIGLMLPDLAAALKGWLSPLVFVFTAASFLKVDAGAVARAAWRQPLLPSLLLLWSLVAVPIATAAAIYLFHVPMGLAQALIVWAASPSMTAAIVFAALLGLDVALAIAIATISIILVPLTGPPLVMWLVGLSIGVNALTSTARIAAFVGAALAVAWALRGLSGRAVIEKRAGEINGAIIIGDRGVHRQRWRPDRHRPALRLGRIAAKRNRGAALGQPQHVDTVRQSRHGIDARYPAVLRHQPSADLCPALDIA